MILARLGQLDPQEAKERAEVTKCHNHVTIVNGTIGKTRYAQGVEYALRESRITEWLTREQSLLTTRAA